MNILAIIPARGGSKGLPRKNIKLLNNKPLIGWTIESALQSNLINKTIVNSDDNEIIKVAEQFGAEIPFVRPDDLASDTANSKDVIIHTVNWYLKQNQSFDYIVLLQPTSPFRKEGDIDKMIEIALNTNTDMVVSVKKTDSNPYYVLFEEDSNGYLTPSKEGNFTRRQDCPIVYEFNGSIYVIKTESLLQNNSMKFEKTIKYVMDNYNSVDIDNQFDFDFAEFLLQKN